MADLGRDCLLPGKRAAVCFSIDDIHPAKSTDAYEAGGDLSRGALGRLEWLLERHPRLRVTLFVTADWREISPKPTRTLLAAVPVLRERMYLAKRWPRGRMRLDRHPEFVSYLRQLPRTEIGLHGLYHCHRGPRIPVEFQDGSYADIRRKFEEMLRIFTRAGLEFVPVLCPPGWDAPQALLDVMADLGIGGLASARDVATPISPEARTAMSGRRGVSLLRPEIIHAGRLVHVPANFHGTCPIERAIAILDCGGLLSIKAHIVKNALGMISRDGFDETYVNYLDVLLTRLEESYGESLWWASMSEICTRVRATGATPAGPPAIPSAGRHATMPTLGGSHTGAREP
jgi:hypothetical protein